MNDVNSKKKDLGWGLFFLLFGLYLLAGSLITFIYKSWPGFMPPQFDLVVGITGVLGETFSIILGSLLLLVIGGFFTWLGVITIFGSKNS